MKIRTLVPRKWGFDADQPVWLRQDDVVAWLREEAQRRTDPMSRGALLRAATQIDNGLALEERS